MSVIVLLTTAVLCLDKLYSIYVYTAPGDYTSGGYSLTFTSGQTSAILSVQTLDDNIAELEEFFTVVITGSNRLDKVIIGDPDTSYVIIEDNDGEIEDNTYVCTYVCMWNWNWN